MTRANRSQRCSHPVRLIKKKNNPNILGVISLPPWLTMDVICVRMSCGGSMLVHQHATKAPKPSPETFWDNLIKSHKSCEIKS